MKQVFSNTWQWAAWCMCCDKGDFHMSPAGTRLTSLLRGGPFKPKATVRAREGWQVRVQESFCGWQDTGGGRVDTNNKLLQSPQGPLAHQLIPGWAPRQKTPQGLDESKGQSTNHWASEQCVVDEKIWSQLLHIPTGLHSKQEMETEKNSLKK